MKDETARHRDKNHDDRESPKESFEKLPHVVEQNLGPIHRSRQPAPLQPSFAKSKASESGQQPALSGLRTRNMASAGRFQIKLGGERQAGYFGGTPPAKFGKGRKCVLTI